MSIADELSVSSTSVGLSLEDTSKNHTESMSGDEIEVVEKFRKQQVQLSTAPTAVSFLAQLTFVSGQVPDFTLERPRDVQESAATNSDDVQIRSRHDKLELLRFDSFRACLLQVAQEGRNAFFDAHTGMLEVRERSKNVVRDIVDLLDTIEGEDMGDKETQTIVKEELVDINKIFNVCKDRANKIANDYINVKDMIDALQLCVVATQHKKKTAVEEADKHDKLVKEQRKMQEEAKTALEKSRQAFLNAADEHSKHQANKYGFWDGFCDFFGASRKETKERQLRGATEKLEFSKTDLNEKQEQIQNINSKLMDGMNKLNDLNISKMKAEEILPILKSATETLGELSKSWIDITKFFSELSVYATTILPEMLSDNTMDLEKGRKMKEKKIKKFLGTAALGSCFFHNITATYYEISDNYLMPNLSKLSALQAKNQLSEEESRAMRQQISLEATEHKHKIEDLFTVRAIQFKDHLLKTDKQIESKSGQKMLT